MSRLPDWLAPLPDAAEQLETDRWAIERRGIAGLELMERAARGLEALVSGRVPVGRLAVVCGKGNNGGDGLAVARLLRERGREVDVWLLAEPDAYQGDAAVNLERLPGPAARPFDGAELQGVAGIIDAILGTGFQGEPRDPASAAIAAIGAAGRAGAQIIACDVPSGVDASTGAATDTVIDAAATATFHAGKPGLWISPGKTRAGELTVIDIGIPDGAPVEPAIGLIGPDVLATVPRRDAASTKFAAGSVMVCGGSLGLTGAPCLAAEAAMRAGAGYVTVLGPASLNLVFELALREAMSVPLPDADGALVPAAAAPVLDRLTRADALVLGPGLGGARETQRLIRTLAQTAPVPLVLDADGLNAHAGALQALSVRDAPTVLTPHAGELSRLLECDGAAIAAARLAHAREAAERSGAVVVLKGDDTIVAEPGGRVGLSPGGAPALATAGSGDVLSGVTGAFLAAGLDPFTAACAAVRLHLRAGQLAAVTIGAEGVIAGDVIAALPAARGGA